MQRIGLKTAQGRIQEGLRELSIIERPSGYAICVAHDIVRSQRADELTFLTIDGAVNYVRRHLSPPSEPELLLTVAIVPPAGR